MPDRREDLVGPLGALSRIPDETICPIAPIMFGQAQIATDDGQNGKIVYQAGNKSFMVPVTNYPPADSSSSVDKTA